MPRYDESTNSQVPARPEQKAYRHFGDGNAGEIVAARLQGYNATTLAYQDVEIDNASGGVKTTGGGGGGGGAVTVADGADVAEGATTDAAVTSDTTGTVSGKLRGLVKWAYERMPASLGQKLMAASFPVVIASDQSALTVNSHAVTDGGGSLTVDDGAGSLTVDTTQLPAALTAAGNLKVSIQEDGGAVISVDDNGGSLTVDGTVSVSGAVDTELPAAVALADNMANPTVPQVGSHAMVWDSAGGNWDRGAQPLTDAQLRASAVPVADGGGSLTVDAPVGTPVFARLSDGAAALIGQKVMASSLPVVIASDQSSVPMVGDVDHDAVNTAKVIQVGGHASPVDNPPTAVSAAGDRSRIWVDRFGATVVRRRKIRESYTAVFRLAEAAARLDQTFTHTANTNKQWATLHHTAAATKELQLNKVVVFVTNMTTVAPQGIIELRELSSATPPATGNPAITGRPHRIGTGAHEATALYLPTTAGSEAAVNSPLGHIVFDDAVSVATGAFIHPQGYGPGGILLFDAAQLDDQVMAPTAPVGTYGGWAVVSRLTGATVTRLTVLMVFTEEIP